MFFFVFFRSGAGIEIGTAGHLPPSGRTTSNGFGEEEHSENDFTSYSVVRDRDRDYPDVGDIQVHSSDLHSDPHYRGCLSEVGALGFVVHGQKFLAGKLNLLV